VATLLNEPVSTYRPMYMYITAVTYTVSTRVAQTTLLHRNPYIIHIFIYGPADTSHTPTTLACSCSSDGEDAETEAPTASVTAERSASLGLEAYCALLRLGMYVGELNRPT